MLVTRSADQGSSWSTPRELREPSSGPTLLLHPFGQMRRLHDGRLVFNARGFYSPEAYSAHPDLPGRMSYLCWSDDGGNEWSNPLLVKAGMTETAFLPLDARKEISKYVRLPLVQILVYVARFWAPPTHPPSPPTHPAPAPHHVQQPPRLQG